MVSDYQVYVVCATILLLGLMLILAYMFKNMEEHK